MFDLKQLDHELGLDDDPLDDLDDLFDPDEIEFMARDIGEYGSLAELEAFIGLPASAVIRDQSGSHSIRRCLDCRESAMARKGQRGPHPKRCEKCTAARKRWLDSGGSKARSYKPCCVEWQLDPDPGHRGLCPQCRSARKESRKPVSDRETAWLVNALGAGGWHVEKSGQWLRDSDGWQRIVAE
jgi:hypothetical protein